MHDARTTGWILFSATAFTAAVLLFWIQPLFTKMALPLLGGSPSVWNTAMMFFQANLLLGYAYAHGLARYLHTRAQPVVHIGVLAVAAAFLPVTVAGGWHTVSGAPPALWLLALLTVSVGMPFFAVAATAPLIQRWFSHTSHALAQDPYFLYAASNTGSVAVLLAFPLLIEPNLDTDAQAIAWTFGFAVLVLGIAAISVRLLRGAGQPGAPVIGARLAERLPEPGERAWWIVYSAVPSALLLAVTTHISTDIAAAPLLWVVPLALYLLTFVNAFMRRPLIPARVGMRAMAFALVLLAITFRWREPAGVFLPLHLFGFVAIALGCHAELARRRPTADRLTEYFLFLALGGFLGGAFVAVAAPLVFDAVLEYPLALILSALLLPYSTAIKRGDLVVASVVGAASLGVLPSAAWFGWSPPRLLFAVVLALLAALVLSRRARPIAFALCIALLLLGALWSPRQDNTVWSGRSFFGVYRVSDTADPPMRSLIHGSTNHGGQLIAPNGEVLPTGYYTSASPVTEIVGKTQARNPHQRVGLVGLGSGAMAYYRRPSDTWRYFEIDPLIAWLAADSGYFQFLPRHDPDADVVQGDARLSLSHQADGYFDLLIMDAYSSDAIPVHLLTREAVAMYMEKLADEGVLVAHISNRYLKLQPVVAGAVADLGLDARIGRVGQTDPAGAPSVWVAIARTGNTLDDLALSRHWQPLDLTDRVLWRDSYSSLGQIVRWRGEPASEHP